MSSLGREGKLPAIDIEDVCEYFGGDLDMASMFLNLLNSDVASGSTCAVGEAAGRCWPAVPHGCDAYSRPASAKRNC